MSQFGRYKVLYKLGQGAMAQVFLARDPVLSRFVAVKVLHPELAARKDILQRFFKEARTVAVVRNPHVVEVFDFGQEGDALYLVMEFVDGLSLQSVLKQLAPQSTKSSSPAFEPLDATLTASLICQAAEGLAIAAQYNVVHRDIKPENLLINQQGYLKISDFGIAHVQDDSITKTGTVLGTPLYMSPEQAMGAKPITSQADIFSLGAVCYTCLVGHPPFQGKNSAELFRKIATEPHTPLWRLRPDLDPALANLVETMLQKNPKDRGGGPRWLHRQLKGYLMALGVMDPSELIGGYLQHLSAQGIQTTWKLDCLPDRKPGGSPTKTVPMSNYPPDALPSGSLPIQTIAMHRQSRESTRRMPATTMGAVLGALGLVAAGLVWGYIRLADDAINPPAFSDSETENQTEFEVEVKFEKELGHYSKATLSGYPLQEPVKEFVAEPSAVYTPNASATQAGVIEEQATLVLKSSPPFAEAFINQRFVGLTPVRVDSLLVGQNRIILKRRNTPTVDTLVTLQGGKQSLTLRMQDVSLQEPTQTGQPSLQTQSSLPPHLASTPEESP